MARYRVVGLVVVVAVVAMAAGLRLGRGGSPPAEMMASAGCDTCRLPASADGHAQEAPAIPTGSGRPCLVEFGSDECAECQAMDKVLAEAAPRLKDKLDIVRVDTDVHLAEAQRWRLRIVPTQIMVDAAGHELWRHEGALSADELVAKALRPVAAGGTRRP